MSPAGPVAYWSALVLAIVGWGAVLVFFSVRILRFVLAVAPSRGLGNVVLRVVASLCLVLLYVFTPAGQMLAFDIVYSIVAPNRHLDLSLRVYTWVTPAIGVVSIIVTVLLVRRNPYSQRIQHIWGQ